MGLAFFFPIAGAVDAASRACALARLHGVAKLVDTLDEQQQLEALIEDTKPPVPPECRHLHYLLSTPFRYGPAYPTGSRFRRAGISEGVFYAAEAPETAVAGMTFHRLLFFAESPDTPWPTNPAEYTAFAAEYRSKKAIDLTRGRLKAHSAGAGRSLGGAWALQI